MKKIIAIGCLVFATTANAQWDIPTDGRWRQPYTQTENDWIMPRSRPDPNSYHDNFMAEMRERQREAERQYYETKPWREWNEMRNACDAIGGNDAARADCYRGLGGW